MMLIQPSVNSDWLFNTQSRVLQADWLILETNEKATLFKHEQALPYIQKVFISRKIRHFRYLR